MWKMFDDIIQCNECGGPLGPPPKFMIPPPPLPPSMSVYEASTNCNEKEMTFKVQQAWDNDMCEAIPILDASLYSSQSLQTSAMIAVFSLLLVLIVLISSLFVWKNKRKVQNLLPCKTQTRGPHITGALSALASGHPVTYEDPDAHLGHHRPLVMRHHHNVEVLHSKSIHYPSGYPMTRSPPFLVSNSPGPDPYRSNDNVYEELEPSRDSDGESEPPMQSDDDFAEDELSLPGERSFSKPAETNMNAGSLAFSDRNAVDNNAASSTNGPERHSVLSSASSTQDASTATATSSSSSHNNNTNANNNDSSSATAATTSRSGAAAILSGTLKHIKGRKVGIIGARSKNERRSQQVDSLNNSVDIKDLTPMQQLYDNTSNLMAVGYYQHSQQPQLSYPHPQSYHHSLHHHNNIRHPNPHSHPPPHFYNTIESEVERRNRINAQLKNPTNPAVATIFRERIQYPGSGRYTQQYYAANTPNSLIASSQRSRTNPRSIDRRRGRAAAPMDLLEPTYGYAEPVYRQNYHYESCNTQNGLHQRVPQPISTYPTCIMQDYSSGSISSYRQQHFPPHQPVSQAYQNSTTLYAHGDSSFGSDSGYSHHTPASSIGRNDYDVVMPIPPAPPAPTQKPPSKLANALSFSWSRKKSNNTNAMNMQPNTNNTTSLLSSTTTEASSPNNNSGSSTITSTLENMSSSSSAHNNNDLVHA